MRGFVDHYGLCSQTLGWFFPFSFAYLVFLRSVRNRSNCIFFQVTAHLSQYQFFREHLNSTSLKSPPTNSLSFSSTSPGFLVSVTHVLLVFSQRPFSLCCFRTHLHGSKRCCSSCSESTSFCFIFRPVIVSSRSQLWHFCFSVFFRRSGCFVEFLKFLAEYLVIAFVSTWCFSLTGKFRCSHIYFFSSQYLCFDSVLGPVLLLVPE